MSKVVRISEEVANFIYSQGKYSDTLDMILRRLLCFKIREKQEEKRNGINGKKIQKIKR